MISEEFIHWFVAGWMITNVFIKTSRANRILQMVGSQYKQTIAGRIIGHWLINIAVAIVLYLGGFWQ